MNVIGVCTVAGNIRRSAEIAFGQADCKEFLDLKSYGLRAPVERHVFAHVLFSQLIETAYWHEFCGF